jgi:mRNA interferase MazF
MISVKRGDIYYADLSPVVGSEQGGVRPVLIIQNDVGNKYSPTVIAAAITSRMGKTKLPTHIDVYAERAGLARDSVVLLEQVRTLDKRRLREKMGHLDEEIMLEIDNAIAVSLGLLPHGARLPARPTPAAPDLPFGTYTAAAAASTGDAPIATGTAGNGAEHTGQEGVIG